MNGLTAQARSRIRPLSQVEASNTVYAQAQYYTRFVRVFIPKEPFQKQLPDLEEIDPIERISNPGISEKETNLERAIRRARKKIKDIVFCNDFEHFATLTIASDRGNLGHSKTKIRDWVKNEKRRKGKFSHLIVPEFHPKALAEGRQELHFHALLLGYKGEVKESFSSKTGKPLYENGRRVYELPSFTSGYTNVKLIDKDADSPTRVGFYIQKYVSKNMPILFGKNRYWPSLDLKRPTIQDNPQPWYKAFKPSREYENEYGKIIEFDVGASPIIDMFIEANRP